MTADRSYLRFGEICEHSAFGPRFSSDEYAPDGNVACLRTMDIDRDGRINYPAMPLAKLDLSRLQNHILRRGDLVITRTGAYLGKAAVFSEFRLPVLPGAFSIRFRLKRQIADPLFVRYFFNSSIGQEAIKSIATGSAQPNLNIPNLHSLELPIPPLPEQKAIAAVLGALDDKIELNRRMNATLEAMARALFQSWFVDFDPVRAKQEGRPPTGLDKPTAALFPARFEYSELGLIPQGWRVCQLSELCSYLSRGIGPSYIDDGGVLVLNQKCIRDHQVNYDLGRRHNAEKKSVSGRFVQPLDILVNSTGMGTLGRVAQVLSLSEPTIVDSHVTIVRSGEATDAYFLGVNLTSRESEIEGLGEGSTGQTELSRARLGSLPILSPHSSVQAAFGRTVEPLFGRIAANLQQSRTLAALRDTLLPKLLSGEMKISETQMCIAPAAFASL